MDKEIEILSSLEHQNVVKFIGLKKYKGEDYMVMEFMNGGSLLEYIRKNELLLTENDLFNMSIQIASGMNYLEQMKIIHK